MITYLESLRNIKYTSHGNQNDIINIINIINNIINIINKVLLNKIVSRVNTAKCFSDLTDETADISRTEQVLLCVIYINILKLTEKILQ